MRVNSHGAEFLYKAISQDCISKIFSSLPPYRTCSDKFADATLQTRLSYSSLIIDVPDNYWLYELLWNLFLVFNEQTQFKIEKLERPIQVIKYPTGGCVDWHLDSGPPVDGLVRKLSMSIQLTEGATYEGGDLEFAAQPTEPFTRMLGTVACFPSYCVHQVRPVTKGERISLVCFALGAPFT